MNPVWVEFPRIPWGSIGWRMGPGENYWHEWTAWFNALSSDQKGQYKNRWPESGRWVGFYDFIEHGTTPPWAVEDRQKVEAAAHPPAADETEITESFRVRWLLTRYLKRSCSAPRPPGITLADYYTDPVNGEEWIFVVPEAGLPRLERAKRAK